VNLIVDASVVYKWLVVEPDSEIAINLRREHDLLAPDLVLIECRNAALTNFRKGELTRDEATRVNRELLALQNLRTIPSTPLLSDAFAIALELRHPIYDCVYVAVAIATQRLLVTADKRFAAKLATSTTTSGRSKTLDSFAATQ
jgi:predicted nucleic acid-binding protein